MFRTRIDGNEILEFNEKYLQILNYTLEEVKGKPSIDFWVDKKERELMVQMLKENGRVTNYEFSLYNKQKQILRCLTSLILYPETGILEGSIIDISDRKRAEDELVRVKDKIQESEEKYRSLFENLTYGFELNEVITDEKGDAVDFRILEANTYYEAFSNLKPEDIVGKTFKEIMPNTDNVMIKQYCDVGLTGIPFTFEYFSQTFNKHVKVHCYSPKHMQFACIFEDITERKKTENEIKKAKEKAEENEKKFSMLFQMCPEPLTVTSLENGRFVAANEAFFKKTGFSKEETIDHTSLEMNAWLNTKDREQWSKELKKTGSVRSLEIPFRTKEYGVRDFIVSSDIIELDKERCSINFYLDITERKKFEEETIKAKEKAEESENRYKLLYNNTPVMMQSADMEGHITSVNDYWLQFFGYKYNEVIGTKTASYLTKASQKIYKTKIKEFVEKGVINNLEAKALKKNGEVVDLLVSSKLFSDSTGKPIQTMTNLIDITEKKQVERELIIAKEKAEEIKERFDYATTVGKVGTWDWNILTDELIWSTETYRILGYEPFSIKPSYDLFLKNIHPDDRENLDRNVKAALYEKKPYSVDCRIIIDDEVQMCNATARVEYNDESKPIRMIGTFQNITDRKRIEQELIIAKEHAEESDRLKTAFLQNMSHEIRTPLNAIMGFSDLLMNYLDDHDKLEEFTNIIKIRSNDLLDIINDILDISRIESGSLTKMEEEFKLVDLFNDLEIIFEEQKIRTNKKNISIFFETDDKLRTTSIITDKGKLKQILVNLISNALKFTDLGYIKCSCKLEVSKILFIVSDTGIGIPPDKITYVFERFAQLNSLPKKNLGGTGLGLPIVKGLVNLLGGDVWVNSEVDKGSEFCFTIEYKISESQNISKTSKQEVLTIAEQHKTVLIVEDDFYNSEYIKTVLTHHNINAICADTAKEGIRLATEESIDLILMDIQLPDINGYEATRKILELNPKMKIIAQTAYANIEEKEKAKNMGCIDYISKPINKDHLIEIIQKHF